MLQESTSGRSILAAGWGKVVLCRRTSGLVLDDDYQIRYLVTC